MIHMPEVRGLRAYISGKSWVIDVVKSTSTVKSTVKSTVIDVTVPSRKLKAAQTKNF